MVKVRRRLLLCLTLFGDGALPPHFEGALCSLEVPVNLAEVSMVTNMQNTEGAGGQVGEDGGS